MVVDVDTTASLVLGTPRKLLTRPDSGLVLSFDWDDGFDVSPDGQRFLMVRGAETEQAVVERPAITIVENWVGEFE